MRQPKAHGFFCRNVQPDTGGPREPMGEQQLPRRDRSRSLGHPGHRPGLCPGQWPADGRRRRNATVQRVRSGRHQEHSGHFDAVRAIGALAKCVAARQTSLIQRKCKRSLPNRGTCI